MGRRGGSTGTGGRRARAFAFLFPTEPPDDPADRILAGLPALLGADRAELLIATPGGHQRAVVPAAAGPTGDVRDEAAAEVLATGEPVVAQGGPVLDRLGMASGLWLPLRDGGDTVGVLRVAWADAHHPDDADREVAVAAAAQLAGHFARELLATEVDRRRRQRGTTLALASQIAGELDVAALARRIVAGVTEVTDFTVATLTVREGDTCRRVAAAGVDEPRIGLRTDYARWHELLQERFRRRSICFLLPPEDTAVDWVQTVAVPRPVGPIGDRGVWTQEHGLIVELLDGDGGRIGFLSVDAPASGLLPDDEELEQLELFARQAQTGLRNAWLHDEIRRQRDAAEALGTVGQAVSSSLDLGEVLHRCGEAVVARSVGDRASVFLYDDSSGTFRAVMSEGHRDPALWRRFRDIPPATLDTVPVFAEAMRTGEPVLVRDVGPEHVQQVVLDTFALKSMAVYPLSAGEQFVGVLVVDTFAAHTDFPSREVELVRQIAVQAAVAIHQAQLHGDAREHAARAAALYELTKEMTRTFDFDTVVARIAEAVTTRTGAYAVGLMEVEDDHLALLWSNVGRDEPLPYQQLPLADIPADVWARLSSGGSVRIDDLQASPLARHARARARSLLVAGHRDDEGLSLVLHLSSDRPGGFDQHDEAFAQGLVETAALALRNTRLYESARHAAERDSLTGLKNRRMYWEETTPLVATASDDEPVALAVLDIDDFKAINDAHGHDVGDRALTHVADRIRRSVRETDRAYRLGGEEFTVVMPHTSAADASAIVERIRRNIARSRTDLPAVTVSAGVASAPEHAADMDGLFRAADQALYTAKSGGKDTVALAPA
jgi:diguanylate cyclase (GGDEF)-like protein